MSDSNSTISGIEVSENNYIVGSAAIQENNSVIDSPVISGNDRQVDSSFISESIYEIVGYPGIHIFYEDNDILGKIDYPLIDIYFDSNDDWVILKSEKNPVGDTDFYIIKDGSSVEWFKEKMSILTFPVGRGTTEQGNIYVFKNYVLLKETPFLEIYISDDGLNNLFEKATKDEIDALLLEIRV